MYQLLLEQNPWWSGIEFKDKIGIVREHYLKDIKKQNSSDLITILSGVRRSGKSTLMYQNIKFLLDKEISPANILYFNFFYIRKDLLNIGIFDEIYNSYIENVDFPSDGKKYIFFDEVQEVKGFESWILKFSELNKGKCKIFLTGSSSGLSSSEISTYFTGRNVTIKIYPLDFKEFLMFRNIDLPKAGSYRVLFPYKDKYINALANYLKTGGFPEIVLNYANFREIISSYLEDIIYRDIIRPFGIEKTIELEGLATFLLSIATNIFSYRKTSRSIGISYETVRKYIACFEKSSLFYRLPLFSLSKLIPISENAREKIYVVDHGLMNYAKFSFSENLGAVAENIVFNYLYKKYWQTIGFYRERDSEIDFVYISEDKTCLVQVTYTDEINKREELALLKNQDKFKNPKNMIITKSTYTEKSFKGKDGKNIKIRYIPLWCFLLC